MREEKKLNVETFGQTRIYHNQDRYSSRGGYANYRGRGGYRRGNEDRVAA